MKKMARLAGLLAAMIAVAGLRRHCGEPVRSLTAIIRIGRAHGTA